MIEIKCTQEEKENILCALFNPDNYCFVPAECVRGVSCDECLENNIKWVIVENENYVEKLVNAVSKTIVEAFEGLTITDVDMYRLGYEKAIDDVLEILKKYNIPFHSDANYEILQLKEGVVII